MDRLTRSESDKAEVRGQLERLVAHGGRDEVICAGRAEMFFTSSRGWSNAMNCRRSFGGCAGRTRPPWASEERFVSLVQGQARSGHPTAEQSTLTHISVPFEAAANVAMRSRASEEDDDAESSGRTHPAGAHPQAWAALEPESDLEDQDLIATWPTPMSPCPFGMGAPHIGTPKGLPRRLP